MSKEMTIQATYELGLQFEVASGSGHHLTLDTGTQEGGNNAGFSPMEMLLVGLAGCTGINVVLILRKKQQNLTSYQIRVHGTRASTHPMVFLEITVEHTLTGHNIQPQAVARAIELSETRYCGVSVMLSKTARITHTFHIHEEDTNNEG